MDTPRNRACCGQPMANTGCPEESASAEALFVRDFAPYDCVIAPSDGSCLMHQQDCADRAGIGVKPIHTAKILNGARA